MHLQQRLDALAKLGQWISTKEDELQEAITRAYLHNKWFTKENTHRQLEAIANQMLSENKLNEWISKYTLPQENGDPKTVGLVMAGNLPLVGFHDILSVWITGNRALVKSSSKDQQLLPVLIDKLVEIEPAFADYYQSTERLKDFDAIIATGSDNSARYFEEYFGKYPNIIRKNRNSIAIIKGDETPEDIHQLGDDIFSYFGLGCRNVSKLYVPKEYDFVFLLDHLHGYEDIMQHDKYKNNYDYFRSIYLLDKTPHLATDFVMVKEDPSLNSRIAILHYEHYNNTEDLAEKVLSQHENIQCIVERVANNDALAFGQTQQPELWDYADKVDTVDFLQQL